MAKIIVEDSKLSLSSLKKDGWTHLTNKDHIPKELHSHVNFGHHILHKDVEQESDYVRSTYIVLHKNTGKITKVLRGNPEK